MGIAVRNSLEQLKRASELLEEAVALLQRFGMSPEDVSRILADAGALLQSVDLQSSSVESRVDILEQLRVVKVQEQSASALLESDMALRFGNLLQRVPATNGYGMNGAVDQTAAHGFQIEA